MNWALLGSIALSAVSVGGSFLYVLRLISQFHSTETRLGDELMDRVRMMAQLQIQLHEAQVALEDTRNDLSSTKAALATAEKQRDQLLDEMVDSGSSNGIAAAIRSELQSLHSLSGPHDH